MQPAFMCAAMPCSMTSPRSDIRDNSGFRAVDGAEGTVLFCFGDWTVLSLGFLEKKLPALQHSDASFRHIDLGDISRMDTAGALFLVRLRATLARNGKLPSFCSITPDFSILLKQMAAHAPTELSGPPPVRKGSLVFLNALGKNIVEELRQGKELTAFLGHFLIACVGVIRKPGSFRLTSLIHHMEQTGLAAVPIVSLLSFLIGLVIAYMGAQLLVQFGANIYVVNLVEISILRELGVLITAIVVAGRSGSSITAEVGAMQANEEVDAMRTMGLDPMTVLVLPRVIALLLMLPALVFLADIMAILGGATASLMAMDLSFSAFAAHFQTDASVKNLLVGLVKAPFFALVIGLVGCFQGFHATGSAESVGRLTTQSVVESIFLVIVLNALFAIFFMHMGV